MGKPKFKKGSVFVDNKNSNKQTGSDNLTTYEDITAEQAKCHACGCDACLCIETICSATTGELLGRYYTGSVGGPYTEVIEPLETARANVEALYAAR